MLPIVDILNFNTLINFFDVVKSIYKINNAIMDLKQNRNSNMFDKILRSVLTALKYIFKFILMEQVFILK